MAETGSAVMDVHRVRVSAFGQRPRHCIRRNTPLDHRRIRPHLYEIETMHKIFQDLELATQRRTSAARSFRVRLECSVGPIDGKRVVKIVVESASGQDEVPALDSVGRIGGSVESCFVQADDFVESVIQRHALWRARVMEIENGDGGVRVLHFR